MCAASAAPGIRRRSARSAPRVIGSPSAKQVCTGLSKPASASQAARLGALAGSADAAKGGAAKLLDTSGLEFVLLSLTPRHVEILKLLAAHQKALRDRPKHVKERPGADQAAPEGMLFKALKTECRYKMIATSEDQVKNYLVELTDHNLVTKKVHLGSVFVCMAPDYVDKILAANV